MTERDEERLARLNLASYSGTAYRHQSPGFDPRSGTGARRRGGRFNPPRSFQVLYLALSVETAAADLRQAAERMNLPLAAALPREVFVSTVSLDHVLDLRASEALAGLEATRNQLLAADQARSRVVGEATWRSRSTAPGRGEGEPARRAGAHRAIRHRRRRRPGPLSGEPERGNY